MILPVAPMAHADDPVDGAVLVDGRVGDDADERRAETASGLRGDRRHGDEAEEQGRQQEVVTHMKAGASGRRARHQKRSVTPPVTRQKSKSGTGRVEAR